MKKMINKKNIALASILFMGASVLSCYDKFDPESYQPPFTIGGYSSVDEIEPSSLVGYWSFDGDLTESVSGSAASNSGSTFVGGFKGQAINVNVADKSYVTHDPAASISGLQSFTISFWVNPTFVDADANGSIDGILGLVSLASTNTFWGNIEWFVENNSNNAGATLKVIMRNGSQETDIVKSGYVGLFGNWTSHTLTYDAGSSTLRYYINGSVQTTKTTLPWTGNLAFANVGDLVFGATTFQTTPSQTNHGPEPWASYLTGQIDEVRIYNKALSAADINALVVLQGKGK